MKQNKKLIFLFTLYGRPLMNQPNNDTKPVVVQLPVSLYEGALHVMETELQLPREYQPAIGSFFLHEAFPGRLSVHWWGLNAVDGKIYMCLSVGYSDSSRTAEEWLADHPEWHVTKDPLVILEADDSKESSDS